MTFYTVLYFQVDSEKYQQKHTLKKVDAKHEMCMVCALNNGSSAIVWELSPGFNHLTYS